MQLSKDTSQTFSVFWRFARDDEEFDVQNPFEKHGISKTTGQKSYLPWHIDDLRQIVELMEHQFDSSQFT